MLRIVSFVLTLLVISSLATKAHAKGKLIVTIDRIYMKEIYTKYEWQEWPLKPTIVVSIKNTTDRLYKSIYLGGHYEYLHCFVADYHPVLSFPHLESTAYFFASEPRHCEEPREHFGTNKRCSS